MDKEYITEKHISELSSDGNIHYPGRPTWWGQYITGGRTITLGVYIIRDGIRYWLQRGKPKFGTKKLFEIGYSWLEQEYNKLNYIIETPFSIGDVVISKLNPEEKYHVVGFEIHGADDAGNVTHYLIQCSSGANITKMNEYEIELETIET